MKGKITVLVLIIITIIVLVFIWFWIQNIIDEYNLVPPDSIINGLH
ncbi:MULTISPECIES: hypothetical protein [Oceanobacillus]|uniref:Uncharacterized protein n=1 Tax=Oceanobacillus kimchii TaxID=746691 RepID=A0ABQ5TQ38_9BACI|nr:hypothetical protein [Oceanobacillus kimchii]GLO68327.1 hypothetical protein MACH08_41110 [Oceanobacillus kimchii]